MSAVRCAVVGHVEWVEFVGVERVPLPGEIAHATETWEQAGGGGAVAAVQLSMLAESVSFFTALGGDALGHRAKEELQARGIAVHAAFVETPQRRALTFVDETGQRTITTLGPRLEPRGHDDTLPWHELAECDAVYFCAGDLDALVLARRARILVATARELGTLRRGSVEIDALVGSGTDQAELYRPGELDPEPRLVVSTSGALGGWAQPGGPVLSRAAADHRRGCVRRRRLFCRRPDVCARIGDRGSGGTCVRGAVRSRGVGWSRRARRAGRTVGNTSIRVKSAVASGHQVRADSSLSPEWVKWVAQWVKVE